MASTPYIELDLDTLATTAQTIVSTFPEIDIYYALKANSDPQVLLTLQALGLGMEIASNSELQTVQLLGMAGNRAICLHPIKQPSFLQYLHRAGISLLAADAREELAKIAEFAPQSHVLIRCSAPFAESQVPLFGKFGCAPEDIPTLFRHARSLNLKPMGVTFHVGSQCNSIETWKSLIYNALSIEQQLRQDGHTLHWVSLGGGLPAKYTPQTLDWGDIALAMRNSGLSDLCQRTKVTLELGRSLVASCGRLVTTVIGTATRSGRKWVYLDAGIYHGLFETLPTAGGICLLPDVHESSNGCLSQLAGPTCDSLDTIGIAHHLPSLSTGDKLVFRNCGAYSTPLATTFNGFPAPQTTYIRSSNRVDNSPPNYRNFDPNSYLSQYYTRAELASDDFCLVKHLFDFASRDGYQNRSALDFGCGPTLHYSFSIAPYFQSISLADYLPANLTTIRRWIDRSPDAHDWDPLFKAVLECEGTSMSMLEHRKAALRAKISSLTSCNIRSKTPIDSNRTFDFVMSYFCLECVATSTTEWNSFLEKVCNFLSPDGRLFMATIANGKQYRILDQWFSVFPPSPTEILASLKLRFSNVDIIPIAAPDWAEDGFDQIYVIKASN